MNRNPERLKAILSDLDGTVYFRGEMIPGADRALDDLRLRGFKLRFLTNTDSKSTETIHEELARMGLDIPADEIFTPVTALREFLDQNPGKRCRFLISKGLQAELEPAPADGPVDYVVVGDFRESVSYEALNAAFRDLMDGAELIALQKGRCFYDAGGPNIDTGAFVALLEYASGKTARVLGKPSAEFFNLALKHAGCGPEEALVVGDSLASDITGAKNAAIPAVLVRTGQFDPDELERSQIKPDLTLASIADLSHLLCEIGVCW